MNIVNRTGDDLMSFIAIILYGLKEVFDYLTGQKNNYDLIKNNQS